MTTETLSIEDQGFMSEGKLIQFAECVAPLEHMKCLREWLKDASADYEASHNKDRDYYSGQITAFQLCLDLLGKQILDSDQEQKNG